MIVVDINLLLYATFTTFEQHEMARAWFEGALNGGQQVLLPAVSLFGFVRIATNPRIFESPLSLEDALASVEAWLSQPHVHSLVPGPRHLEIAFGLLRKVGAARNLTTDVQLAAHAIENQAILCSNDSDFGRFAGLNWENPLAGTDQES
ncbi:MAG TPA: type II toxin-antitoxin system VapC family toxin [Polyangiaceae bacterium]|nr:type II toxin-antitoxin system VapC family toxin [Polyangiaceae bacterium]